MQLFLCVTKYVRVIARETFIYNFYEENTKKQRVRAPWCCKIQYPFENLYIFPFCQCSLQFFQKNKTINYP